ncbi:metalloregulator ArsR/SmtB family transcription factor [Demequina sp. SYSU T00039]|uniref:Metalloregulator ArsR/SmtB family transcription factor n=1 Tax=Demequina lignilytica TaxID=3051663 RepID=A0AAW7M1U5_9MICO|nr:MULTISPECIES: metalloregulator ArsR/SmtB family transcription factor [unclassified Demequina]MDN4478401.1 metalloregulator ArsR/SmtB family transcription factor [Demequina sp. SYSU T00039-1]MDN4487092.1 metalloregulator ArsR/SmtB family transcription factor [Demequina sp. SYSU T00039]MDN4489803.1 metalloregulator ArsR/SmtB family transcription factor [Demequina sp. SYSU T00068]
MHTGRPLNEVKADLFKGLAHPVRIRVLELLAESDETTVADLLDRTGLEPSHLSQHLRVLRGYGLVLSERTGSSVSYRLAHPSVAGLLAAARIVLRDVLEARGALAELDRADAVTPAR